jgi:BMFP domain-containing protein YqiC
MSGELSEKLKEFFARQDRETRERIAALEARVAALEGAELKPKTQDKPDA